MEALGLSSATLGVDRKLMAEDSEIQFPVLCHYKIIAENIGEIKDTIQKVLHDEGVFSELKSGHHSEHQRYITFDVEILVTSKDYMNRLDHVLRNIPGVKMVL